MSGLLSIAEEFAISIGAKVTLPTKSLLQGKQYVPAASTDLKALFERLTEIDFNDDAAYTRWRLMKGKA